jgi:thiamine biosynthesis lipoprotein
MRKVDFIMGMPISVDIPTCDDGMVFESVFNRFKDIDQRFSAYKSGSELSKYQRAELELKELSPEFREVINACKAAEKLTDGYFSAYFSGNYDPTGYVKGWSIAEAGRVVEKKGYKTYCIGAGGDILARSNSDRVWNVGIQDPKDKTKILSRLSIKSGSVATSGNYERGSHIINPKTGKPAGKFLSVSVTGPDIITADILATAIFAAGSLGLIQKHKDYKVFAV